MKILGIDAGATWIKAGRFSADGMCLEKSVQLPSGAAEGVPAYFDSIRAAVERLAGGPPAGGTIGIAIPGTFTADGAIVRYAANIKGLSVGEHDPIPVAEAFAGRLLTKRIVADNDASCAGRAEWKFGAGKGLGKRSLLHVTWGTGLGTAWVVKGKPQYGWEGGHLPVTWSEQAPTACSCGSARDLEAFCSVPHLALETNLPPEAVVEAARSGEETAAQALAVATRWLARGLHMMSVLVYPDLVTIGGGFMATDWLLEQVREEVGKEADGYLGDTLRPDMVHRAQLGNDAGMIGAAMLAREKFIK